MKKLRILSIAILLCTLCTVAVLAFGDDVDYGYDYSYDDYDYSYDYDYGSDSDYGGENADMETIGIIIAVIVIGIVLIQIYGKNKNGTNSEGAKKTYVPKVTTNVSPKSIDTESLQNLADQDLKFSAADIEAKVKTWYLMFETAWCDGDMTPCRPFISDGLFNTYQMQLENMRKLGEMTRSEDIAVTNCEIEKWINDGTNEYLSVWMKVKLKTYKVDTKNPDKVVKGYKDITYHIEYRWQLMRSAGSTSEGGAGYRVTDCPNCGAQTSINQSGKCEYCGSTIVSESHDWVLNKVDKISQSSY